MLHRPYRLRPSTKKAHIQRSAQGCKSHRIQRDSCLMKRELQSLYLSCTCIAKCCAITHKSCAAYHKQSPGFPLLTLSADVFQAAPRVLTNAMTHCPPLLLPLPLSNPSSSPHPERLLCIMRDMQPYITVVHHNLQCGAGRADYLGAAIGRAARLWPICNAGQVTPCHAHCCLNSSIRQSTV